VDLDIFAFNRVHFLPFLINLRSSEWICCKADFCLGFFVNLWCRVFASRMDRSAAWPVLCWHVKKLTFAFNFVGISQESSQIIGTI